MKTKSRLNKRSGWWRREETQKSRFRYRNANGKRITEQSRLARIESLVIPPAWAEVRINPCDGGRVQAVGIDKAGREQYLYHPHFVARSQRLKFAKLERFGLALPQLRRIIGMHLQYPELHRDKVLAIIVRLIDDLSFGVGSEKNVRRYRTYGISTLRNRHLIVDADGRITFRYVGKHHITHQRTLEDSELAEMVLMVRQLPGSLLFQYLDESGTPRHITPHDINRYIKDAMGEEFSARYFRVWAGTLAAAATLADLGPAAHSSQQKKSIVCMCKTVAKALGNTPAICRSAYIHPTVTQRYTYGITIADYQMDSQEMYPESVAVYKPHERELLRLFAEHMWRRAVSDKKRCRS